MDFFVFSSHSSSLSHYLPLLPSLLALAKGAARHLPSDRQIQRILMSKVRTHVHTGNGCTHMYNVPVSVVGVYVCVCTAAGIPSHDKRGEPLSRKKVSKFAGSVAA